MNQAPITRVNPTDVGPEVVCEHMESTSDRQDLSIHRLLEAQTERTPNAIAITAPGRAPLTYGRLRTHVSDVVKTLNGAGVGCNDRVAIVLPNGPEIAVACAAVAAGATSAPLNPAYGAEEFDFYLVDLGVKALIVQSGTDSSAVAVARARGIPVFKLSPVLEAEAGIFTLTGETRSRAAQPGFAKSEHLGVLLHTSGTTSRPKLAPLTQGNLCTSALYMRSVLDLGPGDRCLNLSPQFHVHGLMVTLSSLLSGASVVCTPGFHGTHFFEWLEVFRPTWYTAVPTIHQAILSGAPLHRDVIARCSLRFIRSSSSSLPRQVMAELERVFKAPVIESYGMTEACLQITCNPLPPGTRKAGSVGVAAGPEVAIMDKAGHLLPPTETGEIVIRGPSIMRAYENNPAANARAFTDGWFRTGDQGFLDPDGYLFITGRLREIINRGGEKISPREVDEVLTDHPAVAQAVAFAVPHTTLGEDVAAAVVLRENATATERELREFVAARLADFKVPRRVVFVEEIPKGPTGKPQRIALGEKLGLAAPPQAQPAAKPAFTAPRTPVEEALAGIWARMLGLRRVSTCDNFFELGGDSVSAVRMLAEIETAFGKKLRPSIFFGGATIEYLAGVLAQDNGSASSSSLVRIQPRGSKCPFFCVHGIGGEVLSFAALARHLGPDQPFYGLQAQGLDEIEDSFPPIEAVAARYIEAIRAVAPEGPYFLGGYSAGGTVAFEMAQQLRAGGDEVAFLAIFDHSLFNSDFRKFAWTPRSLIRFIRNISYWLADDLLRSEPREILARIGCKARVAKAKVAVLFCRAGKTPAKADVRDLHALWRLPDSWCKFLEAMHKALVDYTPQVYPGRITLFRARASPLFCSHEPDMGWRKLAAGGVQIEVIRGAHDSIIKEPYVQALAEQLRRALENAQTRYQKAVESMPFVVEIR